jgi:hypothetical protein
MTYIIFYIFSDLNLCRNLKSQDLLLSISNLWFVNNVLLQKVVHKIQTNLVNNRFFAYNNS